MRRQGQSPFEEAPCQTRRTLFERDEADRLVGLRKGRVRGDGPKIVSEGLRNIFYQMLKDFKCFTRIIVGFDHYVKAQSVSLLLQAAPEAQYSIRLVRWRTAMNFPCRGKDGFSQLYIGRITADL